MSRALVVTDKDVRPEWNAEGVPGCTREECPAYDGKRCRAMGFRPESICEPAVVAMADAIRGRAEETKR